jgi:predicted O-methyltransferase YrrM
MKKYPLESFISLLRYKATPSLLWHYTRWSVAKNVTKLSRRFGVATAEPMEKKAFQQTALQGQFSTDWFDKNIDAWLNILQSYKAAGRFDVLEIGAWEGRATLFLLSTFPHCHVTSLDTWEGADEHASLEQTKSIEQKFDANLKDYVARLRKVKNNSLLGLPQLVNEKKSYDVIYVDGSHYSDDVLHDAINAWKLVKTGGVIIFDDFMWNHYVKKHKNPLNALCLFLRLVPGEYRIVHQGYQLAIQRLSLEQENHKVQ